jgi:hypothetical protein
VLTEWEERVLQDRANEHAIDDDDSSDDEADEEWEKRMEEQVASTGVPPLSHFQVGSGGDGFKDFIGGGQSSSSQQQRPRRVHQERVDLSQTEQERSEEASLYWEDAMADLEEAMKKLAPNERSKFILRIYHYLHTHKPRNPMLTCIYRSKVRSHQPRLLPLNATRARPTQRVDRVFRAEARSRRSPPGLP